jgi:hypothetical protein
MSLDMSPSMFSKPSGIHQPIAGSVMNAIMGHMTQQGGIGNLFSGGNNYTDDDRIGGIQSHLPNLMGEEDNYSKIIHYYNMVNRMQVYKIHNRLHIYTASFRNDE